MNNAPAVVPPQLVIVNGHPATTSLNLAQVFDKRHDNVVRAIEQLDIPAEFRLLNFEGITYLDDCKREQKAYQITRDGFTLLAMGFTGKAAMKFKLAYLAAFNAMEAKLIPTHSSAETNLNTALIETTTKMLQVMDRIVDRLDRLESAAPSPATIEKPAPHKPLTLNYSVRSFTPTTLGNRLGLTGKEFNLLLESEGLQVSIRINEQKQWRPTLAGESHSILLDIGKSRKSGFCLQQLRWFDSVMPLVAPPPSRSLPAPTKTPPGKTRSIGLRELAQTEGMRMRDLAATLIAAGLAKRVRNNELRPTARAWEYRACAPNSKGHITWYPEAVRPLIAGRKVAL